MKTRILDTNNFVRLVIGDVAKQKEIVKNVLNKAKEKQLNVVTAVYTLSEFNSVLKHRYEKGKLERMKALSLILNLSYLQFPEKKDRELSQLALSYFEKYNLDLEDCLNLAYAKLRDWELFTFDTEMKKVAKVEGIKRMP